MAKVAQVLVPGGISELQRSNLERDNLTALNRIFFRYTPADYRKGRLIVTIPSQSVIINTFANTEEAFDGSSTFLTIGTNANMSSIIVFQINTAQVHVPFNIFSLSNESNFGEIIKQEYPIYISITSNTNTKPTRGRGFGIIEWLNLDLVQGYSRG